MDPDELERLVAEANRDFTHPRRNRVVPAPGRPPPSTPPRFEVYHAAPSLCSHKVRFTLAEKGVPFTSHDLDILRSGKRKVPQCYRPAYVRLRLAGAENPRLVDGYTGRSAVDTEGFDPAVVPTLVDHEANRVVVDSARICAYIDEHAGTGPDLQPADLAEEIGEQLRIVDRAPHVALLYGENPEGDFRPRGLAGAIEGVHARKEVSLRRMKALVPEDATLQAAYDAKIAKERAAADFVANTDSMATIVGQMREGVEALEARLDKHGGEFACGDRFTLADVVWGASLFRMKWIGIGHLFSGGDACPRVAAYAERLFERPACRQMVIEWPGAHAPSPHVPGMNTPGFTLRFFRAAFLPF